MYLYLLNVSTRNSGAFDVFVLLNPSAYIEIAQVQLPKEIAVKRTPAIVMLFMYLYTYILCVGGEGWSVDSLSTQYTLFLGYLYSLCSICSITHTHNSLCLPFY